MGRSKSPGPSKDGTPADSFWSIGGYKRVTKRIDDGATLIEDLVKMVQDRAAIERKYANHLKAFSKRWAEKIDKGTESGTLRSAWVAMTEEATSVAAVHEEVELQLVDKVIVELQQWKKERFTKGMIGGWKITKRSEDAFAKATKPWAKACAGVEKTRRQYHLLSKQLKHLQAKMEDAKSAGGTAEDIGKLSEKISKLQMDVHQARGAYKEKIKDLEEDLPRYEHEMRSEYDNCQDSEQQRIDLCKRLILQYQAIVKVDEAFGSTWEDLKGVVTNINSDADLVKYTGRMGTGMPLVCPQYYEHSEDPATMTHPTAGAATMGGSGSVQQLDDSPVGCSVTEEYETAQAESDEEWEGEDDLVPPPPEEVDGGVPVQALYDYEAEDPEEISFKAGDVLTQVEDEDDQGWCKGVHSNGQFGLYPANYVEAISG